MSEFLDAPHATATRAPAGAMRLLQMTQGIVLHHALCAAAALGVADLLEEKARPVAELAAALNVSEDALHRMLRFLAGHGVFVETAPRAFANSEVSTYIRSNVPGSMRAMLRYRGSPFYAAPFADMLYSVQTSKPSRQKLLGMGGFEYLRANLEEARLFDEAMSAVSSLFAPAIASAYDFGQWGTLADVGGGSGILLAAILRAHPSLRGTLMELEHVLQRAREAPFLSGDLSGRVSFVACDFFNGVPAECRAYLMKSVIHDWDDDSALEILRRCRRAVPADGALLLVEHSIGDPNTPTPGKAADLVMLVGTGGKERTVDEYAALLAKSGFRLNQAVSDADTLILESLPVANM
jgi:C-methyltransferase